MRADSDEEPESDDSPVRSPERSRVSFGPNRMLRLSDGDGADEEEDGGGAGAKSARVGAKSGTFKSGKFGSLSGERGLGLNGIWYGNCWADGLVGFLLVTAM